MDPGVATALPQPLSIAVRERALGIAAFPNSSIGLWPRELELERTRARSIRKLHYVFIKEGPKWIEFNIDNHSATLWKNPREPLMHTHTVTGFEFCGIVLRCFAHDPAPKYCLPFRTYAAVERACHRWER
jgi:hypothetical protein